MTKAVEYPAIKLKQGDVIELVNMYDSGFAYFFKLDDKRTTHLTRIQYRDIYLCSEPLESIKLDSDTEIDYTEQAAFELVKLLTDQAEKCEETQDQNTLLHAIEKICRRLRFENLRILKEIKEETNNE